MICPFFNAQYQGQDSSWKQANFAQMCLLQKIGLWKGTDRGTMRDVILIHGRQREVTDLAQLPWCRRKLQYYGWCSRSAARRRWPAPWTDPLSSLYSFSVWQHSVGKEWDHTFRLDLRHFFFLCGIVKYLLNLKWKCWCKQVVASPNHKCSIYSDMKHCFCHKIVAISGHFTARHSLAWIFRKQFFVSWCRETTKDSGALYWRQKCSERNKNCLLKWQPNVVFRFPTR